MTTAILEGYEMAEDKTLARPKVLVCSAERFESGALARGIGKRRQRRAFRCTVCGFWHLGGAVKTRATPDADDPTMRRQIRQSKGAARKEERLRAETLSVGHKVPAPSELVKSYQARAQNERVAAAKKRQLAKVAASAHQRRELASQARKADDRAGSFDADANRARAKQLDDYWAAFTDAEIEALATLRGEPLEITDTEVPDWVRGQHGELARDNNGLPILRFDKAKARRRISGLALLLIQGRKAKEKGETGGITEAEHEAGIWYGQVCADAEIAGIAGREETGIPSVPACKASVGPAGWKLDAIYERARANSHLLKALPPGDGEAMVRLLERVCYEGQSVHAAARRSDAAEPDPRDVARLEAKVATGLAMLRVHLKTPRPKPAETNAA